MKNIIKILRILFYMLGMYFQRNAREFIDVHVASHTQGVYVPDLNVIFYQERQGNGRGPPHTSSTTDPVVLKEMKQLLEGVTLVEGLTLDGVTQVGEANYYGIKVTDFDEAELKRLVQDVNIAKEVETGIDALLEKAK